jgi:hypothetical protein
MKHSAHPNPPPHTQRSAFCPSLVQDCPTSMRISIGKLPDEAPMTA